MGNTNSKDSDFDRIPNELRIYVLGYLNDSELCRSARVCRRMKDLSEDNVLWMRMSIRCTQCISLNYIQPLNFSVERSYKTAHIRHRAFEKQLYEAPKRNKFEKIKCFLIGSTRPLMIEKEYSAVSRMRYEESSRKPTFKLLLLGCGQAGKSTTFNQMKLIFKGGFTDEEKMSTRRACLDNILQTMVSLISYTQRAGILLDTEFNKNLAQMIIEIEKELNEEGTNIEDYFPNCTTQIATLWQDSGIQKAYKNKNLFQIYDHANYFMEHVDRISSSSYVPTHEDIVRCRSKTLGVVEMSFTSNSMLWTLVDTGGERNERKKWAHCYDGVAAVLHVVDASEYNQILFEDNITNRMVESLKLFGDVCNNPRLKDCQLILILNKTDTLKEKIMNFNPKHYCFPDYDGSTDYESFMQYVEAQFLAQNQTNRKIHILRSCALDGTNVKKNFETVQNIVLHKKT